MKKLLWTIAAIPLVLLILAIGISGYYVHSLPFNMRAMCATGEPIYSFLPPACRAYIKVFYPGDTSEGREKMSSSLGFLLSGYDINKDNIVGERSLQLADLFIDRGADVNFVNYRGQTPLHEAVSLGEIVLVKFLLSRGANPDKRTFIAHIGETLSPLELARKLDQEGNNYEGVNWKDIIGLLEAHAETGTLKER